MGLLLGFCDWWFVCLVGFAGVRCVCGLRDLLWMGMLHALCVCLRMQRLCFAVDGGLIFVCLP